MKYLFLLFSVFALSLPNSHEEYTATEIVAKANEKRQGDYSQSEIKMTIIRPDWKREMQLKSWSKGDDLVLILVTSPARDKGTAFLKRDKEMWNWQPKIDRVIKMPPSMMSQSWMGSDFTNDDLTKESSIVDDYEHQKIGEEMLEDRMCWKIVLKPKEEAAVVWGKIVMWIDQKDFLQLKTEFYDEDDYLVNTMRGSEIKKMDDRMLPSILEVVPADEEGHSTRVEYVSASFNQPIEDRFFSVQNMKRVK